MTLRPLTLSEKIEEVLYLWFRDRNHLSATQIIVPGGYKISIPEHNEILFVSDWLVELADKYNAANSDLRTEVIYARGPSDRWDMLVERWCDLKITPGQPVTRLTYRRFFDAAKQPIRKLR